MFKYENTAKVGDYIKAHYFRPSPDRRDQFLVGKVIGKYKKTPFGFAAYEVKLMHRTSGNKRNEITFVPFETTNDYEGRITKLSREEGRSYA
tara:strand:- start:122 stop:397 length:276 start_codon:yes stop_codon:yes gene_type:complete